MKTIAASFGAGALALTAVVYVPGAFTPSEAVADPPEGMPLNAVVRLEIEGRSSSGSGFFIDGNRIVTNHHVIAGAGDNNAIRVRGWIAEGERVFPVIYTATVERADKAIDLAVLEIDGEWVGGALDFADRSPRTGTPVCKAGAALGRLPQITCGLWGAKDENALRGVRHWSHSAPSAPGDSGGPVFDEHHRVVGVTRAVPTIGFSVMTTMGLAIPLDIVREFLESDGDGDETEE
jgi:S1-C subfamily serine protease